MNNTWERITTINNRKDLVSSYRKYVNLSKRVKKLSLLENGQKFILDNTYKLDTFSLFQCIKATFEIIKTIWRYRPLYRLHCRKVAKVFIRILNQKLEEEITISHDFYSGEKIPDHLMPSSIRESILNCIKEWEKW